jgi:hypothetical protein
MSTQKPPTKYFPHGYISYKTVKGKIYFEKWIWTTKHHLALVESGEYHA